MNETEENGNRDKKTTRIKAEDDEGDNDSDDPTQKLFDQKSDKISDIFSYDSDLKKPKNSIKVDKIKAIEESENLDEELKDRMDDEDVGFEKIVDSSSSEIQPKKTHRYALH